MSVVMNDDAAVVMMNALLLLMDIYIAEKIPEPEQFTEKVRYSKFLFWLRQRYMAATTAAKETTNGENTR